MNPSPTRDFTIGVLLDLVPWVLGYVGLFAYIVRRVGSFARWITEGGLDFFPFSVQPAWVFSLGRERAFALGILALVAARILTLGIIGRICFPRLFWTPCLALVLRSHARWGIPLCMMFLTDATIGALFRGPASLRWVVCAGILVTWFGYGGWVSWATLAKRFVVVNTPVCRICPSCGRSAAEAAQLRCGHCGTVVQPFASCPDCGQCLFGVAGEGCPECACPVAEAVITKREWYIPEDGDVP